MATLVHEVIHAFMFDTLSDAGLITFDDDGAPLMTSTQFNNLNCNNLPETATTNLNAYNTEERFAVMMCSLIENGLASTTDWSHDLFGNTVFSVETYQEQLANFLLENHDWENENSNFKNEMMSYFGQEWKEKTAQAVSWVGLVKTDNYVNLVNSLPGLETLYFDQISRQRLLINDANSNCN